MIPQTLFSYLNEVYRYKFLAKLCTNYSLTHYNAFKFGDFKTGNVKILRHKIICPYAFNASTVLLDTGINFWYKMHWGLRCKYPSISSGRCTVNLFLYTYFKPIFSQLSLPAKEAVFIRTSGSPGVLWDIRMRRIFQQGVSSCSFSPGVTTRVRVGTFIDKYLRPFWARIFPPGREMNFNRMNGSPGDPPGNLMKRIINQRIVPFIHRLAGDPTGKEAGWETNIGDTKHVNKHIN